MECAVTVSKIVTFGFTRFLLIIHLDVAVAVIHKDADLAWGQFTAFLNPCDLTIVINRLHTIAADTNTKISTVRDCTLWKRNSFKILTHLCILFLLPERYISGMMEVVKGRCVL